ncbi:MAG: acyl-CoA dehydrogenase [Polyangiaceae bacterium]|jgi:acyl-CoA dehydrogenase
MTTVSIEEQESIRQSARAFVRERAPVAHFRELRDTKDPLGFSLDLWLDLAKLGFPGLVVPEAYGGAGLGYAELGIVAEELGRNLVPTPIVSNVLGAGAVMLAGTDVLRQEVLPGVCTGERVIALAGDEGVRFAPYEVTLRAERRGAGFVLHGEKSFVLDAYVAGSFVVVARTSGSPGERDGLTLLHALADDPGVTTTSLEAVDSRSVGRVRFDGVPVEESSIVGAVDRGAEVMDRVLDCGTAVLAAEMLGGMQEALEQTLAYLKTRKQFGVLIGSFQALRHRAAWMFCEVELTRSLAYEALRALDAGRADARELVSAAKAKATETYRLVTNEAVQMHGGIGVTDEADIGLYLKRARVAGETLGGAGYHRDAFAKARGY